MWLRRLLWADGGTLALALETKGRGCWPRTMAASVCLFVCVSVTRLREPRLPCIADVRVLLVKFVSRQVLGRLLGVIFRQRRKKLRGKKLREKFLLLVVL